MTNGGDYLRDAWVYNSLVVLLDEFSAEVDRDKDTEGSLTGAL